MKRPEGETGPEARQPPERKHLRSITSGVIHGARWILSKIPGLYTALGLYFLIGFTLAGIAVFLFARLVEAVEEGVTHPFDTAILHWMAQHQNARLDAVALEITALGSTAVIWVTVLVASAFLWLTQHRYSVLLLWISMLGGSLLNVILKATFARPRPQIFEWRVPYAGLSSFPSGHSMTSMIVYGTLAYLVIRLEASRRLRRVTFLIVGIVVLLVGISRIYLGVHYPSDVLAGYMIGFAWATICAMGIEVVRVFRKRKPELEQAEKDLATGLRPVLDAVKRRLSRDGR